MADFFKKLNSGKTAPEGDLIIASNLKSIEPDLDQDDPAALFAAGYCIHLNTFKEPHRGKDNYTHKWVNNGEKRIGEEAANTFDFDWVWTDETSSMSSSDLDERKEEAWRGLRLNRKLYLLRTDWWELPSQAPMSEARTTYRQALRDLPANTTDPFDVTWPTPPEDIDH